MRIGQTRLDPVRQGSGLSSKDISTFAKVLFIQAIERRGDRTKFCNKKIKDQSKVKLAKESRETIKIRWFCLHDLLNLIGGGTHRLYFFRLEFFGVLILQKIPGKPPDQLTWQPNLATY
jgi:hypothetical protein